MFPTHANASINFKTLTCNGKTIINSQCDMNVNNAFTKQLQVNNESIIRNVLCADVAHFENVYVNGNRYTTTTNPEPTIVEGLEYTVDSNDLNLVLTTQSQTSQIGQTLEGPNSGYMGMYVVISKDGTTIVTTLYNISFEPICAVYDYDGMSWIQRGSFLPNASDWGYGSSVAISENNNTVILGNPSGSFVTVYDWDGATWVARPQVTGSGDFGVSVALSNDGNVFAVVDDYGITAVYSWVTNTWVQRGSNFISSYPVGVSLSADGNTVVVTECSNPTSLKIYDWNTSIWVQRGVAILGPSSSTRWGEAISMSDDGNVIIVGAYNAGSITAYNWTGSDWIQKGNTVVDEYGFGYTTSISANGNVLASGNNSNTLKVFQWTGSDWALRNTLKNTTVSPNASWGLYNSLSSDGLKVAIGAPYTSAPYKGLTVVMELSDLCVLTLPDASLNPGRKISVQTSGLNVVNNNNTIIQFSKPAVQFSTVLTSPNPYTMLQSNGVYWVVVLD